MRWVFIIFALAAIIALFGVGPIYALYAAFLIAFINFATLCIQYDEPLRRAQQRVRIQLSYLQGNGKDADLYQRLQSATPVPTVDDRRMRYGVLTILNIVTGGIAFGFLIWGMCLRMF